MFRAIKLRAIDLKPLLKCDRLRELCLESNQIESIDLRPLARCGQLVRLMLQDNRIKSVDISPLFACKSLLDLRIGEDCEIYPAPYEIMSLSLRDAYLVPEAIMSLAQQPNRFYQMQSPSAATPAASPEKLSAWLCPRCGGVLPQATVDCLKSGKSASCPFCSATIDR